MANRGSAPKRAKTSDSAAGSVAAEITELHATISVCTRCPLSETRKFTVPGEGSLTSVVMFIGEGPGSEEDRNGRPFIGRSGRFLESVLADLGIAREDVFITSAVKCRPPNNRDPQPNELEACSPYLARQIELIDPRIIVTLGRISMQRWFPGGAITKIHGQIKEIGEKRVAMPMFHPAAALRNPAWRKLFEEDMAKLPTLIEKYGKDV